MRACDIYMLKTEHCTWKGVIANWIISIGISTYSGAPFPRDGVMRIIRLGFAIGVSGGRLLRLRSSAVDQKP